MDDDAPPRIPQHEAVNRFGTTALRTAHELTAELAANDGGDEEPVVLRRSGGRHRSLAGLAALIDTALVDTALIDTALIDTALIDTALDEGGADAAGREPHHRS